MQLIARVDDIPPYGLVFAYKEGPIDEEGILLRLPDRGVVAYQNLCRHLPMRLNERAPQEMWSPDRRYLVCNAHGARYRPDDGLCVAGPCEGSHLRTLPIEIRGEEIYLDTTKVNRFIGA